MLEKDRSSPIKSMLLIIEFDRVRIDDHERIVLHFEPVRFRFSSSNFFTIIFVLVEK